MELSTLGHQPAGGPFSKSLFCKGGMLLEIGIIFLILIGRNGFNPHKQFPVLKRDDAISNKINDLPKEVTGEGFKSPLT